MSVCKIVIADDHVLIRRGLKKIIDSEPSLSVIGDVNDGLELLSFLKKNTPDLILLDISMPKLRGVEAIGDAKKICPKVKVLVLTMHAGRDYLCNSIHAGADGYLLKEDSDVELLTAIDQCINGKLYISPVLSEGISNEEINFMQSGHKGSAEELTIREKQVLTLVAEGKKSKAVGNLLSISTRTVDSHRANIMKKIDVKNTAELIKYAIQNGYVKAI